jgi:hypothetical protein
MTAVSQINDNEGSFDYSALSAETSESLRARAQRIREVRDRALLDVGKELTEAQSELANHAGGIFQQWAMAETGLSKGAIYNLINVYKEFGSRPNFGQLPIDKSAMYLLAAPSTPEEVREEAVNRATAGETITHKTARQMVGKSKPKPTPEEESAQRAEEDRLNATLERQLAYEEATQDVNTDLLDPQMADYYRDLLGNDVSYIRDLLITKKTKADELRILLALEGEADEPREKLMSWLLERIQGSAPKPTTGAASLRYVGGEFDQTPPGEEPVIDLDEEDDWAEPEDWDPLAPQSPDYDPFERRETVVHDTPVEVPGQSKLDAALETLKKTTWDGAPKTLYQGGPATCIYCHVEHENWTPITNYGGNLWRCGKCKKLVADNAMNPDKETIGNAVLSQHYTSVRSCLIALTEQGKRLKAQRSIESWHALKPDQLVSVRGLIEQLTALDLPNVLAEMDKKLEEMTRAVEVTA